MQVQAAVHYQPGQGVEIEMLDLEEPRAHEVRVRYVASGVCHSDLHHIQGIVPHPTPVVFGHEGAGIIEAVGPDVTGVQVGDHVLTSYIPSCGRCWYCTIGRPNLCDLRDMPRYLLHDGTSRFKKGDQDIYQYLQLGTYSERATVPDVSVIPIRKDAPVKEICGRDGADYAIEAVGIQKTMEQAFHSVHRGGTAVMIGVPPAGMRLSIDSTLLLQERILTGTRFGSTPQRVDLPMIVDMFMDGKYKLRELISREVELEDLNDAYDRLIKGEVKRSVVRYT